MTKTANPAQVYIVHGYNAAPTSHWFPWLKDQLQASGIQAEILPMPSPAAPRLNEWRALLAQRVNQPGPHTYFIAHSLGCIALLQYLQQQPATIGGMVLVSGFAQALPDLALLNEFVQTPLAYQQIIRQVNKRSVIASQNDSIVPFTFTKELATQLQADFHSVAQGGHFLADEGFSSLPLASDLLLQMITPQPVLSQ